jgi:hypothetical protein
MIASTRAFALFGVPFLRPPVFRHRLSPSIHLSFIYRAVLASGTEAIIYQYFSVLVMGLVELCFRYHAPLSTRNLGEVGMISRSDLDRSFSQLKADTMRLADENDRLRKINAQMLVALQYSLPVLQEGLPEAVNFDWIREAVAKVQGAIAEAARDA